MKTATKKRILTAKGTVNKLYGNALRCSRWESSTRRIYPVYYSGSGRHINLHDHSHYIMSILRAQRYKYTTGNDAPRGGAQGFYIEVSRHAFNFLESLKAS